MQIRFNAGSDEVPYWGNWIGPWAMQSDYVNAFSRMAAQLDMAAHLAGPARSEAINRAEDFDYAVVDNVAVIPIRGVMMKHNTSLGEAASTVLIRKHLSRAAADASVRGIILKIESPGGTVAGTMELAEAVARCDKPTMAYCCDITASAAYWVASQCDTIEANELASVGSIGTYCVVEDSSELYQSAGVKVHVVRAGEFKGAMTPGTEVTEAQLSEAQRIIDKINGKFVSSVASGRGMSSDAAGVLADGRVHLGAEAQAVGLIDRVSTWEDAFERFCQQVSGTSASTASVPASLTEGVEEMSNESKPAGVADLKQAMPNAGSDFYVECIEAGCTLVEAQSRYLAKLTSDAESRLAGSKLGVQPAAAKVKARAAGPMDDMDDDCEYDGDARQAWLNAIQRELPMVGGNRGKAVLNANRKHPGLRVAMLQQINARSGRSQEFIR